VVPAQIRSYQPHEAREDTAAGGPVPLCLQAYNVATGTLSSSATSIGVSISSSFFTMSRGYALPLTLVTAWLYTLAGDPQSRFWAHRLRTASGKGRRSL
jgi:hypothetical protein